MVVIEVDLKEGDKEPEQHLDDGEHIERIVVPLDQLYEKLQGMMISDCTLVMQSANNFSLLERGGNDRGCAVSILSQPDPAKTADRLLSGCFIGRMACTGARDLVSRANCSPVQTTRHPNTSSTNTSHTGRAPCIGERN